MIIKRITIFVLAVLTFTICIPVLNFQSKTAYAATTVDCDSGTPLDSATLDGYAGTDVIFDVISGDGTCILQDDLSATSVTINSGVTLTHPAESGTGITITTTGNFTIQSNAIIDVDEKGCSNSKSPDNVTNICADNGTDAGEGEGKDGGYMVGAGGAGHGGSGGDGHTSADGGNFYGSATAPVLLGSGGGQASTGEGGSGGGKVRIDVGGDLSLNGFISANGADSTVSTHGGHAGGGGSGGSIYISVSGGLSGTGSFSATGGSGNDRDADGGGGAGGRVAIEYGTTSASITSSTFDVSGGAGPGAATDGTQGTVYVKDTTNNDVMIYHGFTFDDTDYSVNTWTTDSSATNQNCAASTSTPSITATGLVLDGMISCDIATITSFNFAATSSFSIGSGAVISVNGLGADVDFDIPTADDQSWNNIAITVGSEGYFTLDDAISITMTGSSSIYANTQLTALTGLTMGENTLFNADEKGCPHSESPDSITNICADNGTNEGEGEGKDGAYMSGAGGAGHGGAGGAGHTGVVGGNTYDSLTAPVLFGSGGGDTPMSEGGNGGGIIRINVAGDSSLNGTFSANGADSTVSTHGGHSGGGGSGGSIYVSVSGELSGTSSFSTTGGDGNDRDADGGGGGGGRVAIEYGSDATTYLATLAAGDVAVGGSGPDSATDGSTGTLSLLQTVYLDSISITDNSGYTNDSTPTITITESGATPTHVAFSCDGGSNWSDWIAYSSTINSFDITSGATGCTATEELKSIKAKIKDGSSESSAVFDTTTYDVTGPTVQYVTASNENDLYGAGVELNIQVVFNETVVTDDTSPSLLLDFDGTDRTATYASGSGTTTFTLSYTTQTGDNKTDLDYVGIDSLTATAGDTITDFAGNNAGLALPAVGGVNSLGGRKDISVSTNQSPASDTPTGAQSTDGDGAVTVQFDMEDPDDDTTLQALIEYSYDGGDWTFRKHRHRS